MSTAKYICVAPNDTFNNNVGSGFIRLQHPKINDEALYYWDNEMGEIFEVQQHHESHRSWFIGDTVKKDGRLYVISKLDPLFLVLPLLQKESLKFTPIDHLLTGDISVLSNSPQLTSRLLNIADTKESSGFQVCRYSETKTLAWLKKKVDRLKRVIDSRDGFTQENDSGNQDNLELAWALVTEYVAVDTGTKLAATVGLELDKPLMPVTLSDNNIVSKKMKFEEPVEDYSKAFDKENAAKKSTVKTKKPPPIGSQSITNFFLKKKV